MPSVCVQGVHGDHGPKLPSTVRFLVWKANTSIIVRKGKTEEEEKKKTQSQKVSLSSGNHNSFKILRKLKLALCMGRFQSYAG